MARMRWTAVTTMCAALLLVGAAHLRAQGNTGSIRGMVTDEQRLPIPSASLRIEDTNGGLRRSLQTKQEGFFEFAALQPGEYLLVVEATGFQPKQVRVRLEVNQRVRIDVTLSTKGVTENIEVVNTTPLLHTNDASVGSVVDEHQVAKLPLNGRQFLELALLGARRPHVPRRADGRHQRSLLAAGSELRRQHRRRPAERELLSAGRNEQHRSGLQHLRHQPAARQHPGVPDPDRHLHGGAGGAGTGQVNVVTKSGTNKLHGTVYEYLRNSAFDARLFTSPDELPHFSQNQFGATLGGPLKSDRTHFSPATRGSAAPRASP